MRTIDDFYWARLIPHSGLNISLLLPFDSSSSIWADSTPATGKRRSADAPAPSFDSGKWRNDGKIPACRKTVAWSHQICSVFQGTILNMQKVATTHHCINDLHEHWQRPSWGLKVSFLLQGRLGGESQWLGRASCGRWIRLQCAHVNKPSINRKRAFTDQQCDPRRPYEKRVAWWCPLDCWQT